MARRSHPSRSTLSCPLCQAGEQQLEDALAASKVGPSWWPEVVKLKNGKVTFKIYIHLQKRAPPPKGEDVILWKGKTCWVVTNMQNFKIIDIYELKPRVWCKFLKAVWIRSHYRSHQFPGLLWWVDPTSTRHTCLRWMKLRLALMRWIVHRTCNNNLGAFLSYSNRWYEMLSCDPLNGHIDIYR